ncbi:FmdB family zinc ribbon protein [Nocardioides aurantiacus]|uniref:Putative FmdB family regulatory protein n=1 Tax=Nocardioides aurantiacus TaxID=86796 RepID=A0A3N2CR41_9ACTN|nr:FmdB family zinc ribbon protein [Nocardioides aurantiacus]ROR90007.1 putative FmdB family regulatory protein [Nocardioides aurantiacus]
MPTYQYSCTECGHFFEAVQSFSDDSLTVCPVCEGRLRKVFNAVGVVFKGSGFYRNDSRAAEGGASGGSGGSGGSGSSGDGASTSTPKESAPAKKESSPAPSKGDSSSSSQSKSA